VVNVEFTETIPYCQQQMPLYVRENFTSHSLGLQMLLQNI